MRGCSGLHRKAEICLVVAPRNALVRLIFICGLDGCVALGVWDEGVSDSLGLIFCHCVLGVYKRGEEGNFFFLSHSLVYLTYYLLLDVLLYHSFAYFAIKNLRAGPSRFLL